jgi:hypothetical protein
MGDDQRDVIEVLEHDHREVEQMFAELESLRGAEEAQHAREEHAEAEETLARREKLDADDPAFDDELSTCDGSRQGRLSESASLVRANARIFVEVFDHLE